MEIIWSCFQIHPFKSGEPLIPMDLNVSNTAERIWDWIIVFGISSLSQESFHLPQIHVQSTQSIALKVTHNSTFQTYFLLSSCIRLIFALLSAFSLEILHLFVFVGINDATLIAWSYKDHATISLLLLWASLGSIFIPPIN